MLGGIVGVVEQRVGSLVAFEVDDAERLALAHDVDPIVAREHHPAVERGIGIECAFLDHECAPAEQPI